VHVRSKGSDVLAGEDRQFGILNMRAENISYRVWYASLNQKKAFKEVNMGGIDP
jgi:hypothetical protein